MSTPLIECVPNISEGRNKEIINSVAESIRKIPGVQLMDIDPSPAANRTVFSFAGNPEAVTEAAYNLFRTATQLIDMQLQVGVHPRLGAVDVCPFVPLRNASMDDAVQCARNLAQRVGEELSIPVYLYEFATDKKHRKFLPQIRKGQYEGLKTKIHQPDWAPDFGAAAWNAKSGASIIGARKILVAFNIGLNTDHVQIAQDIAEKMRSIGKITSSGAVQPGLLKKLRAIGWYMADYQCAQVSFNLLDYQVTDIWEVYHVCKQLAEEAGISIRGTEIIGLIPESCILTAASKLAPLQFSGQSDQLQTGIQALQLNQLKPFDAGQKILDYHIDNY